MQTIQTTPSRLLAPPQKDSFNIWLFSAIFGWRAHSMKTNFSQNLLIATNDLFKVYFCLYLKQRQNFKNSLLDSLIHEMTKVVKIYRLRFFRECNTFSGYTARESNSWQKLSNRWQLIVRIVTREKEIFKFQR